MSRLRRNIFQRFGKGTCILCLIALILSGGVVLWSREDNTVITALPKRYVPYLNTAIVNDSIPELQRLDASVDSFRKFWDIKGLSLAITRHDSLVYAKGYGIADYKVPMTPGTKMRVASVSKLLTAVAIMKLQDEGLLNLQTPVFGPFGILKRYDSSIRDDNYYMITVEHLLRHQGGFTGRYGDPMFSTHSVIARYGLAVPPDSDMLINCLLRERLDFVPGTSQSYSNFGYLLLSKIIEEVTGMEYERYMKDFIFSPCGCHDMHLAGNYYKDRKSGESRYFMQADSELVPDVSRSGLNVERCYGGNDLTILYGAGGWVCSTVELARFVACIDGDPGIPDFISPWAFEQMTEYYDDSTFALGWVDAKIDGELTRTGTLSGTSALIKVYPDGECWILVTNTSTWRGSRFTRNSAALFKNLRRRFSSSLPKRDLFVLEN